MRTLFIALLTIFPVFSQIPQVRFRDLNHPIAADFQVGDRFEILVTGKPHQPISVRTTTATRTDWSPVIGSTDGTGQWSTAGQFEKGDFGDWIQVWTVGGKLAGSPLRFSVQAPCLPGKQSFSMSSGIHTTVTCETSEGRQTFSFLSDLDPFRTPDGRVIPGRSHEQTQESYRTGILQNFLMYHQPAKPGRGLGDETADLITKLIGGNALTTQEIENALFLLRAAFEKPQTLSPTARDPVQSVRLLHQLATFTDQESLQREIAETSAYLQQAAVLP